MKESEWEREWAAGIWNQMINEGATFSISESNKVLCKDVMGINGMVYFLINKTFQPEWIWTLE